MSLESSDKAASLNPVPVTILTTFCTLVTFLFGHYVLRLNVALNAGATCDAMTDVAIDEVCRDAKSSAPAVAYALPGAVDILIYTINALVLMSIICKVSSTDS